MTSSWRQNATDPGELDALFPAAYVNPASGAPAPPARTPTPGPYNLSVGQNAPTVRSNTVPIVIAARIDLLTPPATPTGIYTLAGAGFAPGTTSVSLGATALAAGGRLAAGRGPLLRRCGRREHHLPAAEPRPRRRDLPGGRRGERRGLPARRSGDRAMTTISLLRANDPSPLADAAGGTVVVVLSLVRARAARLALWMGEVWRAGQSSPDQGLAITPEEASRLLAADAGALDQARYYRADAEAHALTLEIQAAETALGRDPTWSSLAAAFDLWTLRGRSRWRCWRRWNSTPGCSG